MADNVDLASDIVAETVAIGVAACAPIARGTAGDCEKCEYWFPRLVGGLCGFCRDGRRPPDDWEPHQRPADWEPHPTTNELTITAPMAPAQEEVPMASGKSIMLPAAAIGAINAVEMRAKAADISLGQAAAELIIRGVEAAAVTASAEPVAPALGDAPLDDLLAEIGRRAQGAASPAFIEQLTERVDTAERKLAGLREMLS